MTNPNNINPSRTDAPNDNASSPDISILSVTDSTPGSGFVTAILDRWPTVLVLFLGVVVISIGGVYVGKLCLFGFDPVVVINQGVITISGRNRPKTVVFPLSATTLWADTGIDVAKGQHLVFQVAGAVNTAIHRVVNSGKYDVKPPQPWITHPGEGGGRRPHDKYKLRARLYPEAQYGSLLGLICCPGTPCPVNPDLENLRRIRENRHDPISGMTVLIDSGNIGKPGEITAKCSGRLYLTINENTPMEQYEYMGSLDENAEDIFEEVKKVQQKRVPRAKLHDEIVEEWLADAVQWVFDFIYREQNDETQEKCDESLEKWNKEKMEAYCRAPRGDDLYAEGKNGDDDLHVKQRNGESSEKDAVCCARYRCRKYFDVDAVDSEYVDKTALELAMNLLPLYAQKRGRDELDSERFDNLSSEGIRCLASLRRVSDYYRWKYQIGGYPEVWYDENSGFFWVTIQID